jgi:hypothetical protein
MSNDPRTLQQVKEQMEGLRSKLSSIRDSL